MRIGHVVSQLDRRAGGVTAAAVAMAISQQKAGLDVSVLTAINPGDEYEPVVKQLRAAGVKTQGIGPVSPRWMGWHKDLAPAIDELIGRVDLIHVHALWENIQYQAMRLARRRGAPYVVSPHGMLATWSLKQSRLKKSLYLALRLRRPLAGATALHFTTQEEAKQARPLRLPPVPVVEPLGIDLSEFATVPDRSALRRRVPQIGQRPIVLFMSRLHPKKGLDLLVPAFAKVGDSACLVIAGPGDDEYTGEVRALVDRHGLADRTFFTGMLRGAERIEALASADVFVLPSYQENFGIVVAEALAAGVPVIVSDQVNLSEHLVGQPFATIVPCAVEPLASAIGQRLMDLAHAKSLGPQARQWTFDTFDADAIGRHWVDHYARIVGRH